MSGHKTTAVSVVTYRSAALTVACLHSLLPERGLPSIRMSVVVVDNASGNAREVAIEAEVSSTWVTLIGSPRNGGFAYVNNPLGFDRHLRTARPNICSC
jgi:N-acetylglucosaminyl-diphospho-decaprenol L-rhamnosyltransferase